MAAPLARSPSASESSLWFELAMLAVAVFGLGYYGVARDLGQTLVVRMGAIGKVGFVIVIVGQWLAGNASWQLVALVMGDFVYALFFFDFLCNASGFRHKTSPQSSGRHA